MYVNRGFCLVHDDSDLANWKPVELLTRNSVALAECGVGYSSLFYFNSVQYEHFSSPVLIRKAVTNVLRQVNLTSPAK